MTTDATVGIRLAELELARVTDGEHVYEVSFREPDSAAARALSVVAGPSQTGKTSIAQFVLYALGGGTHPQHPEIIAAVRAVVLEVLLGTDTWTIERLATGRPSRSASLWKAPLARLGDAVELRVPTTPPSEPQGLSQMVLAACDLDNVAIPETPADPESSTELLSVRDLFQIMWLANDRTDHTYLPFASPRPVVRRKLQQTVDVIFDVEDGVGTDFAARLRFAAGAAREARRAATALRSVVQDEYPPPTILAAEDDSARREEAALAAELAHLDRDRGSGGAVSRLRHRFAVAQDSARQAAVRVRHRESLLERLAALRGQYADDKRKLTFVKEAQQVFDPLRVSVCPACLASLAAPPSLDGGACSLCGHQLPEDVPDLSLGTADATATATSTGGDGTGAQSPRRLDAELWAAARRLDELNDYWTRLDDDLQRLKDEQAQADRAAEEAAAAIDQVTRLPAPFLAARDDLARRRADVRVRRERAAAGLRLWERVRAADETAERLSGQVSRLRAEQRERARRRERAAVIDRLSARYSEILADLGYPKLRTPTLDTQLVPSVGGLPYSAVGRGGRTLIGLAWYLALWELTHEQHARAPGLLLIDGPQANLGSDADPAEPDFADERLAHNLYRHVKDWIAGPGAGAQLVVFDTQPPESVADDVVVRYTRDRDVPPYGLIDDALDP